MNKINKRSEIDINQRKICNEVMYTRQNFHLRVQLVKTPNMYNEYCTFPRNDKYHWELLLTNKDVMKSNFNRMEYKYWVIQRRIGYVPAAGITWFSTAELYSYLLCLQFSFLVLPLRTCRKWFRLLAVICKYIWILALSLLYYS